MCQYIGCRERKDHTESKELMSKDGEFIDTIRNLL